MMNWMFSWYSAKDHGGVSDLIGDIYRTFVSGISGNGRDQIDIERLKTVVGKSFRENKAPCSVRSGIDSISNPIQLNKI